VIFFTSYGADELSGSLIPTPGYYIQPEKAFIRQRSVLLWNKFPRWNLIFCHLQPKIKNMGILKFFVDYKYKIQYLVIK
jgi:hypothetical protein